MKLRNLFLVSLAAMAITSCSNENDPIVDSGNTAETAMFNFSIALPNAPKTKAQSTDPGTAQEQNVNDITMVLEYKDANPPQTLTKTYKVADFTYDTVAKTYTLSTAEQVSPGTAAILTIYVNSNGIPASQISATTENGWSLGNYASTTGDGNFLMIGKSKETFAITPNQLNTAPVVSVDRIAVKLEEATEDTDTQIEGNQYTFKALAQNTEIKLDIEATLIEYAYTNLVTKSNTLGSKFEGGKNDYYNYFDPNPPIAIEVLWSNEAFSDKIGMENRGATYCFENGTTIPTTIYYKAKTKIEGVDENANFYVYENVLYKDFAALNVKFRNSLDNHGLSDGSTNAQFMEAVGVKKYTEGVCYYPAVVNANGIDRNNWYKLRVTGIKGLGLPEPGTPPPGAETTLIFSVTENPWTVWNEGIEL